MKTKLTSLFSTIIIATLGFCSVFALPASAVDSICDQTGVPAEVQAASGCNESTTGLEEAIRIILNSVIGIAGLVAVIFIIIGGVKYMTSTGEPGKVQTAQKTILYAVIGLVICALAFVIVNFTINIILDQG